MVNTWKINTAIRNFRGVSIVVLALRSVAILISAINVAAEYRRKF